MWCIEYLKLLTKTNLLDKGPFETINNRFCKSIMGLPKQASNFGVKAELGRSPVFSFICSQVIRYWSRILHMSDDRLLKQAFYSELHIHNNGGTSWASFVIQLLESINSASIWQNNTTLDKHVISTLKSKVTNSLTDKYFKTEFGMIGSNSKLRTFAKFKSNYIMEKYITISDIPLCWRRLYCSFRISCHDLEIERARYARPRKPPEERICKMCKGSPETEQHFIIFCNTYSKLRKDLFSEVCQVDPTFVALKECDKFEYLMTNEDTTVIKSVMKYIYYGMILRKSQLCKVI